jgi:hypothetical protein
VDCSNYNWVRIAGPFVDFQCAHLFCTSYRGHHTCGMIKSPLECLKLQSNGFTHVVTLDSWPQESRKPDGNKLWAHLLIASWFALEGERESLQLCNEEPRMEEVMGRIKFHHPRVRTTSCFTILDGGIHCFCRCSSKEMPLTVGFTSFAMFTLPCIPGQKYRNNWSASISCLLNHVQQYSEL